MVLEEFCGAPLWDRNLTWDTTDPYFTHCFEETALIWAPAAFLYLSAFIDISLSLGSKKPPIPGRIFTILKTLICLGLISIHLTYLVRVHTDFKDKEEIYNVDTLAPALRVGSYILAVILIALSKANGIRSSGVQTLFWLISLICEIVLFRTALSRIDTDNLDTKLNSLYLYRLISLPLVSIQFFMHCWADGNFGYRKLIKDNPSPEKSASFVSKTLYLWFDAMAWKGYRNPLTYNDLWDLNEEDRAKVLIANFKDNWDKAKAKADRQSKRSGKKVDASVISVLFKCYAKPFLFAGFLKLVVDMLIFVQPEMLKLLVEFTANPTIESWKGYLYAAALLLTSLAQSIFNVHHGKRMYRVAIRIKTSLCGAIYRKSLLTSTAAKQESTVGEIVNLMSVDANRLVELMPIFWMGFTAPFQIGFAIYFLHSTMKNAVFAGLGVMLLLIPINGVIATKVRVLQMQQMVLKDERVKLMNEIFSGMKVLKLYGWELSFQDQIEKIRAKEYLLLKKAAYLNASTMFSFTIFPFLVALATFATFVYSDENNILNAENAFVSLSLLNILKMPLTLFPMVIALTIQAYVSVVRINKYMNSEELDVHAVSHDKISDPIKIEKGDFSWSEEMKTLSNINMTIKSGSLTAVVGKVGSGKSSLLSALLGDLKKDYGYVNINGSLAYVAQGAWIQNASLRENILFGDVFLDGKYNRVIEACALRQDLAILGAGDKTEIGEKGINLSGGQKQRVALARAAYKECDIVLLDDPLSAVDAHVGKHIFEELICGLLNGKTRVLVTHSVAFLSKVDDIIVMKDGGISERGNFRELLKKQGDFAEFLMEHLSSGEVDLEELEKDGIMKDLETVVESEEFKLRRSSSLKSNESIGKGGSTIRNLINRFPSRTDSTTGGQGKPQKQPEPAKEKAEKLIEAEKLETGNVSTSILKDYFNACGIALTIITLAFQIVSQALSAYSSIWLSDWSEQATKDQFETGGQVKKTTDKFISIYAALGAGQGITIMIGTLLLAFATLKAAMYFHANMLNRVFRAPMSYYDTTPLGRLVNRFSRDVDTCDLLIPINIRGWLGMLLNIAATFVVISYSTPIFLSFIIPTTIFYFFLQRFYVATSRQLKRMESVTRSPIYSHFSETISGTSTIRAFGLQDDFIHDSEDKIDTNQKAFYPFISSNIWVSIRLETIGALIIFAAALFSILARDTIEPGIVGLSISYALQVTSLLNFFVRIQTEVETNIVSVERMVEITKIPQEAPFEIQERKPSKEWPQKGSVAFQGYQTRYREGLDLVLKGVDCQINPGEKIGIVGRTGAGKSSLTLALFRLIEPAGGRIMIDGIDISQLGLHDLRSKLTIIPQDPVLFSGNLRVNLDPFQTNSDDRIWECLRLAHLHEFVRSLPEGLEHIVAEEGSNFSVGQRQLICLARALLRKTKILVLDEASSSLDLETDDLLQKTIRSEFKDCTIITIAHRLNTILDSDRVIVLDKGMIEEFDTPQALLANQKSIFYEMAKDANLI